MKMSEILLLVILGLTAGFLSGTLVVGGGLIIIPVLMYFLNMSQHGAQGTSLAFMLPPISIGRYAICQTRIRKLEIVQG